MGVPFREERSTKLSQSRFTMSSEQIPIEATPVVDIEAQVLDIEAQAVVEVVDAVAVELVMAEEILSAEILDQSSIVDDSTAETSEQAVGQIVDAFASEAVAQAVHENAEDDPEANRILGESLHSSRDSSMISLCTVVDTITGESITQALHENVVIEEDVIEEIRLAGTESNLSSRSSSMTSLCRAFEEAIALGQSMGTGDDTTTTHSNSSIALGEAMGIGAQEALGGAFGEAVRDATMRRSSFQSTISSIHEDNTEDTEFHLTSLDDFIDEGGSDGINLCFLGLIGIVPIIGFVILFLAFTLNKGTEHDPLP